MRHQRAILLTLLLFVSSMVHARQPVQPCTTNKNAPPVSTWHWPAGTRVKVSLVGGMFKPSEQQAIREVLDQWNSLSEQIETGIEYDYVGEVTEPQDRAGYLTLTRLEMMKGTNNKFAAYFFPNRNADGSIRSAVITFDFMTTELTALKSYVAHEMAHGMGLWDCKSCERKSTIMNAFPNVNQSNGLIAPSACDLQVVKTIFDGERKIAQLSRH